MLVFPHAKINLGLHVLRLRDDGYRDIVTALVPIPLCDVLEAIVDRSLGAGKLDFTRSGLDVPGARGQDLCVKAYQLLRERHDMPGLRMRLHKTIPVGAGLGGGSSDGAHALRLLNDLLCLGESDADLQRLAASMGSDCAFFLRKGACLAQGRGEQLTPLTLDLRGWWLLLINPGIHVSTAEVYARTAPRSAREDLGAMLSDSTPETWSGRLVNVMEEYVFEAYPIVAKVKKEMLAAGAVHAAMSGSGSSVFGLFRTEPRSPALPVGHRAWSLRL